MTRDEIEKLSDEELNVMVATEVMGWDWANLLEDKMLIPPLDDSRINWATEWDAEGIPRYLPDYSTDIAAAWEVVYEMQAKGYWFMCGIMSNYSYVIFTFMAKNNSKYRVDAEINELPLAICRTALLAKMQP